MSEMASSKDNMIENISENVTSKDTTFYVAKTANGLLKSKKVW